MSEELTNPTANPADAQTPAGAQNTESTEGAEAAEKAIPYARFKEINERLKAAEKRAAELETADKQRQKAALSEVDRLKAEAAEAKALADKHAGKVRELSLRQVFRDEAEAQKLKFATAQAAADAFALLDAEGIEINEDGNVKGMDKALKELAKLRPYLFVREQPASNDAAAGMGRPGAQVDSAAKERELRQRFRF